MATINQGFTITYQTRPCWVDGRRAIFHRWTDSARPVKPKGMEEDEAADRYQVHNVHALVEYEDGTVARVWPNTVRFADSAVAFAGYDWTTMEDWRDAKDNMPQLTPNDCIKISPHGDRNCLTCGYEYPDRSKCEGEEYTCRVCDAEACRCKECKDFDLWEPRGGAV